MGVGVGRQNEADPCPIKNDRRQTATAREVPNPCIFDHCFAELLLQGKRPSALNSRSVRMWPLLKEILTVLCIAWLCWSSVFPL